MKQQFDFDDYVIEPVVLSPISSRSEVSVMYKEGMRGLPLMTAPMDTVISEENRKHFTDLGIICVLPRTTDVSMLRGRDFQAYGIDEFENLFIKKTIEIIDNNKIYALIDVANGHMQRLYDISKIAKEKYGDKLVLMVGNIANPETFRKYCEIGVDMCRIGVGNGCACITSVQTGIGASLPFLIQECYKIKKEGNYNTKIVADGGFKKYSDIIKALAMGSNYIMIGSIFNKALESAGETTTEDGEIIDQYSLLALEQFRVDIPQYKVFRGMSTKEVQKEWGRSVINTSEGVIRKHKVEYTLSGWVDNFKSYLKSAMSYTGKKELHEFIGGVNLNIISQNTFNRFNK